MSQLEKKPIIIRGSYGLSNFGDDALMVAVNYIAQELFDSDDIAFLCRDSSYIRKILPDVEIIPLEYEGKIAADIFVYGGGTQFFSFPLTRIRRFPTGRNIAKALIRPNYLASKLYHKLRRQTIKRIPDHFHKMAAIGIGVGPFVQKSLEAKRTKALFNQMDFIAIRDVESFNICKNWGVKNLYHRADLCFLPGLWRHVASTCRTNTDKQTSRIGVIIRDWPHSAEGIAYASPLFQVVSKLREAGKMVNFISFTDNKDRNWSQWLRRRREKLITWNPAQNTISDFLHTLSAYDVFITSRYHGAVFASILGKPSVCIGIEQKLEMVSGLLEEGSRLWSYPYDPDSCLKHIVELDRNYYDTIRSLKKVVKRQGQLTRQMADEFIAFAIGRVDLTVKLARKSDHLTSGIKV